MDVVRDFLHDISSCIEETDKLLFQYDTGQVELPPGTTREELAADVEMLMSRLATGAAKRSGKTVEEVRAASNVSAT